MKNNFQKALAIVCTILCTHFIEAKAIESVSYASIHRSFGGVTYRIPLRPVRGVDDIKPISLENEMFLSIYSDFSMDIDCGGITGLIEISVEKDGQIILTGSTSVNPFTSPLASINVPDCGIGTYSVLVTDADGMTYVCDFELTE